MSRCPECSGTLQWKEELDSQGDTLAEYLECKECGFVEEIY